MFYCMFRDKMSWCLPYLLYLLHILESRTGSSCQNMELHCPLGFLFCNNLLEAIFRTGDGFRWPEMFIVCAMLLIRWKDQCKKVWSSNVYNTYFIKIRCFVCKYFHIAEMIACFCKNLYIKFFYWSLNGFILLLRFAGNNCMRLRLW